MKVRNVLILFFLAIFAVALVGCKPTEEPEVIDAIEDVLNTATNNQEVLVEGVVFGVVTGGYYISDSELGKIFVTDATVVAPGDKVKIKGQFGIVSNMPRIKNATSVEITAQGQTLPTPATGSVTSIAALSGTAKTGAYGKFVSLIGTIEETATGYILKDDDGQFVIISNVTTTSLLAAKVNKRVTINVIAHEYNALDLKWRVSFAGVASDIVDTPISFAVLTEMALDHIEDVVPAEISGALVLPSAHPLLSYLTYTWSVVANDYVSIDNDGNVVVLTDTADHTITFNVTITDGTNETTEDIVVISKGIVQREVADLYENMPQVEGSIVILRGIVVALTRNQSLSIRSAVLQDPVTKDTISVDFAGTGDNQILNTDARYTALALGDEIVVRGTFRIASRQTVHTVTELTVLSSGNAVVHDYENAFVLSDEASYATFSANIDLYTSRLVKFEDPFMNYSTSALPSATNWVRLGYSETTANAKHDGVHNFAILIAANNESTGSETWHKMFEIPFITTPAQQFGGSFYAYVMYISDTYLAFVTPDAASWMYTNQVSIEIDLGLTIPASLEEGTIELPTTHPAIVGNVAWSSSDEALINSTTGVVVGVNANTVVTLTATYTYNDVLYTSEYEVTILKKEALTVAHVVDNGVDGTQVKVKGIVVGFHWNGSSTVNALSNGIIIKDETGNKLLYVVGLYGLYGSTRAQYLVGEHTLALGDEIEFNATYSVADTAGFAGRQTLTIQTVEAANMQILRSGVAYTFDLASAIVLDSDEDLNSTAESLTYGQLYKLEGAFSLRSSATTFGSAINMVPSFANTSADDYSRTVTWHTRLQRFSFKFDGNAPHLGDNWWETELNVTSTNFSSTASDGHVYDATSYIYFFIGNCLPTATTGFGYIQCVILHPDHISATRVIPAT